MVEKTVSYQIRTKPSLKDKTDKYIELINSHKEEGEKKLTKTQFFNELLENFFYNRLLEKGFIELEDPQYINTTELIKNRSVHATTEKPSSDVRNQMLILKIPTNLDSWSNKYNTFCSKEPNSHEGIKPYVALVKTDEGTDSIKIIYHVFKIFYYYHDGVKGASLEVSILSPEEVEIFLNQYEEEIAENLLREFKQFEEDVAADIDSGLTSFEIIKKYDDPTFLRMLIHNQNINNAVSLVSSLSSIIFDNLVESSEEFNNISKDFYKELEEKGSDNFTSEDFEKYEQRVAENTSNTFNSFNIDEVDLNVRDSKTLNKFNEVLEENPDNPLTNLVDNLLNEVTEMADSEEPIPNETINSNVLDTVVDTAMSVKNEGLINPELMIKLLEGSDMNEDVLEYFKIMSSAESKEDYLNKIEPKLMKDFKPNSFEEH